MRAPCSGDWAVDKVWEAFVQKLGGASKRASVIYWISRIKSHVISPFALENELDLKEQHAS